VSGGPAGYSGTPLVRKLGIKPDARLGLVAAPQDFDATLGELPLGARVRRRLGGEPFDVIVAFYERRAELERRLPALARALDPAGGLWIAWPKRASGVSTDVTEDVVRQSGLAAGLVDNKVCAIDETWSGLRMVYRLRDRPPR
jgi:alkylation response protein AidB-like acyl-CoA dehydrogenase